jgi:hypothetical protein
MINIIKIKYFVILKKISNNNYKKQKLTNSKKYFLNILNIILRITHGKPNIITNIKFNVIYNVKVNMLGYNFIRIKNTSNIFLIMSKMKLE